MSRFVLACMLSFTAMLSSTTRLPAAVQYAVTDLGTLGDGIHSEALGINNSGQVVGYSFINSAGESRAFLYSGGTMADIGVVGSGFIFAKAINDSGQVLGWRGGHLFLSTSQGVTDLNAQASGGNAYGIPFFGINNSGHIVGAHRDHAALFSNGTKTELQMGGGLGLTSGAADINDHGDIVGFAYTTVSDVYRRAFLYRAGTMIDLGTLGGRSSEADAINNSGQVVGSMQTSNFGNHAFVYTPGLSGISTYTDLGTLGADNSYAQDINDRGEVVGFLEYDQTGDSRAFLYSAGILSNLNHLIDPSSGWTLLAASGINDSGMIVGTGVNPAGLSHAFMATPITIPEPNSAIIAMFGWITFCQRRRR